MPDLESRMSGLLQDLAGEAHPAPSFEQRVLRRSRRRRVANGALAGLTVAAVVVAGFLAASALGTDGRMAPAGGSASPSEVAPTALPAIWPETDAQALAIAQAQADTGVNDYRLDPVKTAEAYANVMMGWDAADVEVKGSASDPSSGITIVTIANAGLGPGAGGAGPPAPETVLSLQQLGMTGEQGAWSVVAADSDRIIPEGEWPRSAQAGAQFRLAGSLLDVQVEWSLAVSTMTFRFHPGVGETTSAGATYPSIPSIEDGPFSESVPVPHRAEGTLVVTISLTDPEGTTVSVESFPVAIEPADVPAVTGPASGPATGATGSAG